MAQAKELPLNEGRALRGASPESRQLQKYRLRKAIQTIKCEVDRYRSHRADLCGKKLARAFAKRLCLDALPSSRKSSQTDDVDGMRIKCISCVDCSTTVVPSEQALAVAAAAVPDSTEAQPRLRKSTGDGQLRAHSRRTSIDPCTTYVDKQSSKCRLGHRREISSKAGYPANVVQPTTPEMKERALFEIAQRGMMRIPNNADSLGDQCPKPAITLLSPNLELQANDILVAPDTGACASIMSKTLADQFLTVCERDEPSRPHYRGLGRGTRTVIYGIRLLIKFNENWYDTDFDVLNDEDMPARLTILLSYRASKEMGMLAQISSQSDATATGAKA